jgi:glycosyl transferase family 87
MTIGGSEAREETEWVLSARTDRLLTALSLALAAGLIVLVGVRWYAYQWDFHMFYGAARDFAAGKSPYRGGGLSFYHPPLMLYVYRIFTVMPEPLACTVWYALKLAALGALISIWNAEFVRLRLHVSTVVFFILAYDGAIYGDLVSGNVSIFEELLLWFGFACLLRARYLMFGMCVIAAAQVKLTPIFFAVLLITACDKAQWRAFFATLAGFAAVFSLNEWLQPALFRNFWTVSAQLDERGVDCTSLLALIRDVFDRFFGATFTAASRVDEVVFMAMAAVVAAISWRLWLNYRRNTTAVDRRLLIGFSCFVFALISPRIKVYTYILLLAPTLYLFWVVEWRHKVSVAVAVMTMLVVFPQARSLFPFRFAFDLFNSYLPLFASAALWVGYLYVLGNADAKSLPATA